VTEFQALQAAVAGRYTLERELGRGGMGIVYLAQDVALERPVAIKILPPALAQPAIRAGFLREARLAAGLSHPNIVSIHLVEERDGLIYFVMGYVDGETLAQRVRRGGPLRVAEATRLLQEVAWALAYAHGRGVVHRDVKAENILIERGSGRAMVSDFGIAHREGAGVTAGEIAGTAQYMSPEQAAGDVVDGRGDLYSLGVTGFFALTGRLPFEGATTRSLLTQHLTQPAPPVATLRPSLPPRLAAAIDRCLAKEPAARFPSGEALAEALGAVGGRLLAVPPLVRRFQRASQVVPIIGSGLLIVLAWTWVMAPASAGTIGTVLAVIWALSLFDLVSHARLMLRGGLGPADIQAGFRSDARARREEQADVLPHTPLVIRLMRDARVTTIAVVLAAAALALAVWLPRLGVRSPTSRVTLAFVGTFVLVFTIPLALAAPERAAYWGRFWGGAVGRWLFRVAGIGVRGGPGPR
jgi:eukaryotic-like serine/threonine-protein kinase